MKQSVSKLCYFDGSSQVDNTRTDHVSQLQSRIIYGPVILGQFLSVFARAEQKHHLGMASAS